MYDFNWGIVLQYFPVLLQGLNMTLVISALATLLGSAIGIVMGLARISRNILVRTGASIYVEIIRGIPLLVFLMYIFFGLGAFVEISAFTAAVLGLGIFSGAYVAEIVRGGIEAIPKGQMEAARSLGMTYLQAMWFIIIPQAMRAILPALAGQFITLIKDSSLVSVISIVDLTMVSKNLVVRTFQPFEIWTLTAAFYLILTYTCSKLLRMWEKKYRSYYA